MIKETKPSKQELKNGDVCHLEMASSSSSSSGSFLIRL